jgi:hypothetical protein
MFYFYYFKKPNLTKPTFSGGNNASSGVSNLEFKPFYESFDTDGRPTHKIILLSGPPGLGKTTLAHVVANFCGYEPLEVSVTLFCCFSLWALKFIVTDKCK